MQKAPGSAAQRPGHSSETFTAPPESTRPALRAASVNRVKAALVNKNFSSLTPEDAWAWNITGLLFGVLPAGHPLKRPLMLDYTQHQVRKTLLQSASNLLQSAWNHAGIRYFAFKGAALQHAYPDRRMRFHGDVDIYVPKAELPKALQALPAGWRFVASPTADTHHNAGSLLDASDRKIVDLHHSITPLTGILVERAARIHHALEAAAIQLPVEDGPPLSMFNWTDQVLASLVINRGWCGDHWRLKAADYLDLQQLLELGLVDLETLQTRATELGLGHSLQAFLSVCNPSTQTFSLQLALRSGSLPTSLDWAAVRDGCWHAAGTLFFRFRDTLQVLADIVKLSPVALDVLRNLRAHRNPHDIIRNLPRRRGLQWPEPKYARTAKWGTYLLRQARLTTAGPCVIRSLVVLAALRNDGIPATWVQGFRIKSNTEALPGHAWLEVDGRTLAYYEDIDVTRKFTVSMRIHACIDTQHPMPQPVE